MVLAMFFGEAQAFDLKDLFGKSNTTTETSDDNSDGILGALGSFIGNMTANKKLYHRRYCRRMGLLRSGSFVQERKRTQKRWRSRCCHGRGNKLAP